MAVQHLIYECEIKKIYRKVLRGHPREPRQETTFAFPSFFNLFSILMCSTIFSCQGRNFIYSKKSLQKFLPSFAVEKLVNLLFIRKRRYRNRKKFTFKPRLSVKIFFFLPPALRWRFLPLPWDFCVNCKVGYLTYFYKQCLGSWSKYSKQNVPCIFCNLIEFLGNNLRNCKQEPWQKKHFARPWSKRGFMKRKVRL